MKYRFNPAWPQHWDKFPMSYHIVRKAIKKFPSDKAGEDLKYRLTSGGNYNYSIMHSKKTGATWLVVRASWAEHCYSLDGAVERRFLEVVELVDSW